MAPTTEAPTTLVPRPSADAPSPPAPAPGSTLPVPLTRFIGREAALGDVERLIETTRLLTVTGAGGSGKTRLALELARRAAEPAAGGVAWVELAHITSAELVPQHVAASLGLREEGGRAAFDTLLAWLQPRSLLLVLDNCEHLVDACAALAERLLRAAPGLRILATSREPLGVPGERAWLIPALTLPDGVVDTAASEAVQLFIERARDAYPAFELTDANSAAVVQICRRLEGMPLAIELAAARVRVLPPDQLALRLDDAFRALGTGSRGALPRHRTLRAVMDWSYALLSQPERTLLERLSVFDGGFTLEAVEAVCSGDTEVRTLAADEVLDLVAALVDRSLVAMRESEGRARYAMLETVRQYAARRLVEAGEEAALRARHATYFVALVAAAEPHLTTVDRRAHVGILQRDADNIRQALAWTRDGAPSEHIRLAGMLCWYWFSSRDWLEGRRWLAGALALPQAAGRTRERAAALFAAGALAALQAQTDSAEAWLTESAAIAAELGDARLEAYALNYLGMALIQAARTEGRAPVEKARDWFRAADDLYGLRLSYLLLSTVAMAEGRFDAAHELTAEGVRIARLFGANRELGIALQMHAGVAMRMGDLQRAAITARESLEVMSNDPMHLFIARSLNLIGTVCLAQGDARAAVRLCAAADAIRAGIGARAFQMDRAHNEQVLSAARAALGDDTFEAAWQEGSALELEGAVAEALATRTAPSGDGPNETTRHVDSGRPDTADAPGSPAAPPAPVAPALGAARIEVRALGRLEVARGGEPPESIAIPYGRPRELLVHLLCHPQGRTREQIGVVFWPEASAAQVKNSFHVALHHLRRCMGRADFVVFEQDRYRINPAIDVWFDAAEFERAVPPLLRRARAGDAVRDELRAALALYEGHFLAGTEAGDWHFEFHDRLQRLCIEAHAALGRSLVAAEEWGEAAAVFERLLQFDELNEDAYRQLMRALALAGDRSRALRRYDRLVALLRDELETEPDAETVRLADAIRSGANPLVGDGPGASGR